MYIGWTIIFWLSYNLVQSIFDKIVVQKHDIKYFFVRITIFVLRTKHNRPKNMFLGLIVNTKDNTDMF